MTKLLEWRQSSANDRTTRIRDDFILIMSNPIYECHAKSKKKEVCLQKKKDEEQTVTIVSLACLGQQTAFDDFDFLHPSTVHM